MADSEVRKRTYEWFIEPLDADTNSAIAREVPDENALRGVADDAGVRHDLYRISATLMAKFRGSRRQCGLKFNLFVREGGGALRSAVFLSSRRRNDPPRIVAKKSPYARVR